ncbi:putative membrane protein [Agrococcus sp. UYP33]
MQPPVEADARRESRAIAAAWACFAAGIALGLIALAGPPRPIAGEGSVALPAAGIAALVAATAFVVSSAVHRRGETSPMPGWQAMIARISTVAITIAFAAVAYLAVLTAGEILALGLQGLQAPAVGGALLTGAASAAAGWLAFQAGVELRTTDLATLLFAFLTIGTVFAMITAADPRWWERHFSDLGTGWAFNLTLIVAGLLVATIGAYIGRDLHRRLGDPALRRIALVVALFALTGAALAGVGIFPVHRGQLLHDIAAFGALGLFGVTMVVVTIVMPGPPRALLLTTVGAGVALVVAVLLWRPLEVYSATALEAIAVGILFVWLTTLVRTLAALVPQESRPSASPSPLRAAPAT